MVSLSLSYLPPFLRESSIGSFMADCTFTNIITINGDMNEDEDAKKAKEYLLKNKG